MKPALSILLLSFVLVMALPLQAKTILPDACGDDSVKFEVNTEKDQSPPAAPDAGKAQIVFEESLIKNSPCIDCKVTTRIGIDGSWAGATKGDSYFSVAVTPGEHHLCASWQSVFGRLKKNIGVTSFTAEAGKVYYYEIRVKITVYSKYSADYTLELVPVNEDEGKYRIKASELAIATPNE